MGYLKRKFGKNKLVNTLVSCSTFMRAQRFRKRVAINGIKKLSDAASGEGLSQSQEKAIENYWGDIKVNKESIRCFNLLNPNFSNFDVRYIPYDLYLCGADMLFNNVNECDTLVDKNLGDLLLHDVCRPRTIARIIGKKYYDEDYRPITKEEVKEKCLNEGRIICKEAVSSGGGRHILFWESNDGIELLDESLDDYSEAVIQESIRQHHSLSEIHSESVNTIRMVTFFDGKECIPLASTLRMGVGSSHLDNFCSGGCFCGIDESGHLRKYGFVSGLKACTSHPDGFIFEGFEVPGIKEVRELSCKLAYRFVRVSKLISWDWAIGEDGHPIYIEANLNNGDLHVSQLANGPLFGDKTREVAEEIMKDAKLKRYLKRNFGY